jgi:hypothetical protein
MIPATTLPARLLVLTADPTERGLTVGSAALCGPTPASRNDDQAITLHVLSDVDDLYKNEQPDGCRASISVLAIDVRSVDRLSHHGEVAERHHKHGEVWRGVGLMAKAERCACPHIVTASRKSLNFTMAISLVRATASTVFDAL